MAAKAKSFKAQDTATKAAIVRLLQLESEMLGLGLFVTARKLNDAVVAVGFEIAGDLETYENYMTTRYKAKA